MTFIAEFWRAFQRMHKVIWRKKRQTPSRQRWYRESEKTGYDSNRVQNFISYLDIVYFWNTFIECRYFGGCSRSFDGKKPVERFRKWKPRKHDSLGRLLGVESIKQQATAPLGYTTLFQNWILFICFCLVPFSKDEWVASYLRMALFIFLSKTSKQQHSVCLVHLVLYIFFLYFFKAFPVTANPQTNYLKMWTLHCK